MKEYIERELLLIGVDGCISSLHIQAKGDLIQESAIKLVEATRGYIASLSAADVVEVRHGRWIFDHMTGEWSYYSYCSECGHQEFFANDSVEKRHRYCYSCGALMDGKESGYEAD